MTSAIPFRDDAGTTRPPRRCAGCGQGFIPARRAHTVYECPGCGDRQLGVQRCPDCGLFGRAAGLGGACPGRGEPVTVNDLDLDLGPRAPR
jgi:predicted RNA-binding Zn-ribbon protein involved in translation (DUF1610 family)